MHNPQSIVMILLQSILTGFGIVIPIFALIRTSNLKTIAVKDLFILTAVQMVRLAGILYAIVFLVQTYEMYSARTENPWPTATEHMLFGSYWFVYWFPPAMSVLLSQLFWIKKLYHKSSSRIVLALFLLILPSTRLMVFIANLGKGEMNAIKFSLVTPFSIVEVLLNIIVFIFITFAVMLSSGKLKKIFSTPN